MSRNVTIPAKAVVEDIMSLEEAPGSYVRVLVGVRMPDGDGFDLSLGVQEYRVEGDDLTMLTGPETELLPGKPAGTYRNQDLWYFVDKQRNSNA